jgi:hypothetical protein
MVLAVIASADRDKLHWTRPFRTARGQPEHRGRDDHGWRDPSFSPEPIHKNDKREPLVSVLDYQLFVGNH